ncbi:MAG: TIGR01212 family radical SAM protein [Clostridia bacterium]|nr:TIGR01212 family radical SAM protein [Clostridia bacterium]
MANNGFCYSDTGKRYHTYDYFLRRRFGQKVAKLPIDGGFTCPNRDGTKGIGGCAFCSGSGSGDFCVSGSVTQQLEAQRGVMRNKWKTDAFIPYFQSGTGTYAPLPRLLALWDEALRFPGAVGLAVATRPDCLPDDVCDALAEISRRTFLTVELGLQTVNDEVALKMGRGHGFTEFVSGFEKLRSRGIPVCVHIIDGLPGESADDMLKTASVLAGMRPDFVKIHLLHVLEGTRLARIYSEGGFETMTKEGYVSTVVSQIELFPPETVFERVTGDGRGEDLIAPRWSRRKREALNAIDAEFRRRVTCQGAGYVG